MSEIVGRYRQFLKMRIISSNSVSLRLRKDAELCTQLILYSKNNFGSQLTIKVLKNEKIRSHTKVNSLTMISDLQSVVYRQYHRHIIFQCLRQS